MWEPESTLWSIIYDFDVGAKTYSLVKNRRSRGGPKVPFGQKWAILISEPESTFWSKIGDSDLGAKKYLVVKDRRFRCGSQRVLFGQK